MSDITWTYGLPTGPTTQPEQRTDMQVEDQFGRRWLYSMENKTMEPTGLIDRVGWSDPLNTPQKYLRVPRNKFGRPELGKLEVQFGRWIEDQYHELEGEAGWRANLWNIAQQKFPGLTTVEEMEAHPVIRKLAGPKPWPSVEALERAAGGQPCLLGLQPIWQNVRTEIAMGRAVVKREPVMTPEAIEARALLGWTVAGDTLPAAGAGPATGGVAAVATGGGSPSAPAAETWPAFMKRVIAAGEAKDMKEAAVLWKARKAA